MWREVLRIINEGTVEGIMQAKAQPTHQSDFYRNLRHSNEVFAAFKVHTMGREMAAKLLDEGGNLKPFDKWVRDVSSISSHQVGSWLRTEYDTAVIRAHAAADWQEFERNKDIFPNLRWMPTTSPDPETTHRRYWKAKLTLPVDDPFWNEHHPGDRWNCKCSLEATDEPVTPLPEDMPPVKPQRGLENNPGKDGKIFNDTHPYFPKSCSQCFAYKKAGFTNRFKAWFRNDVTKGDCQKCPYIDGCMDYKAEQKRITKERKKEARMVVQGKMLTNPNFNGKIMVSRASIDEWTNQPFMYMTSKHQMLLDIERVLREAEYLGPAEKHKNKERLLQSHLFKTHVENIDAYIIVWEFDTGDFILHSISDSPNILKYLKRK